MSRAYFNEYQKTIRPTVRNPNFWDMDAVADFELFFYTKGYRYVRCNLRRDHNGVLHNTWIVPREHVGVLVEFLFKQRIMVEVEATGKDKSNIIFVCDESSTRIREFIDRIPKVEEE